MMTAVSPNYVFQRTHSERKLRKGNRGYLRVPFRSLRVSSADPDFSYSSFTYL